jgi:hypothetical protein
MASLAQCFDVCSSRAFPPGSLFAFTNAAFTVQMRDRQNYFGACNRVRFMVDSSAPFAFILRPLEAYATAESVPALRVSGIINRHLSSLPK